MSNKKKRNKRRGRPADDQCCILCELYGKAEQQNRGWSLETRADDLAASMRVHQQWGGGFTLFIRQPREQLDEFIASWSSYRLPLDDSAEVAVAALERFWESYHRTDLTPA
jgi:hypothetical protein